MRACDVLEQQPRIQRRDRDDAKRYAARTQRGEQRDVRKEPESPERHQFREETSERRRNQPRDHRPQRAVGRRQHRSCEKPIDRCELAAERRRRRRVRGGAEQRISDVRIRIRTDERGRCERQRAHNDRAEQYAPARRRLPVQRQERVRLREAQDQQQPRYPSLVRIVVAGHGDRQVCAPRLGCNDGRRSVPNRCELRGVRRDQSGDPGPRRQTRRPQRRRRAAAQFEIEQRQRGNVIRKEERHEHAPVRFDARNV